MKKISVSLLFTFFTLFLFSQNNPVFEGPVIEVGYKGIGAVRGTAGIIGDNYYVVENDYGRALDFNNNIRTHLSIISLKTGNLVNRIALNEIVASQSGKGINKVLFCSVTTWKDKVVGIYTYKDPNGTEFKASAIILNQDGRVEKAGEEIGAFTHELVQEFIPGQAPGRTGGRNTLSVVNDLWYCFSPDSSRLMIQCTPESGQSNIRFKVFKPGMTLEKDVNAVIPIKGEKENITGFVCNNSGLIYVVTRGSKFNLHTINPAENNKVNSKEFALTGKTIRNATLGFTQNGNFIIAGVYHDDTKSDGMHGAYAIKADASLAQLSVNTRDIPDSVIETYVGKKALKKGEGLFEYIRFKRLEPKPGGGLYAFGQSNTSTTVARGSTGAMNSYYEETWLNAAYSITEEGKIEWESITGLQIGNKELATRHSRIEYASKGETVHGLIILPKPNGIHNFYASSNGTTELSSKNSSSKEIMKFPFVEGTLRQIGANDYAVIGFDEGSNAKYRLMKISL